jgi:hypothetical protein
MFMTQVLFSFDTEDYVNIEAEEAVLRLAQTLSDEDVQGCFCVVGEVAAAWRQRNSRAVLDALRAHEVDAHTWRHSWHPNIVEYSEDPDWDGSLARFLREERYAFDLVMDVCDRERIWAFVKPGNSLSAQGIYGYTLLGAPIFGDSFVDANKGRGTWYCNAFNLNYDFSLERLQDHGLAPFEERLDEWATWERLILYAHPCKLVLTEFWDAQNMFHHNPPSWGDWAPSPRRTREEVERFFALFRELIQRLKRHGGFEFATYEPVWREYQASIHRQLPKEELLPLLQGAARELTWQRAADGTGFTPAELFAAAVHVLAGRIDPFPAWGVMGPVNDPTAQSDVPSQGALTLAAEDIRRAAATMEPIVYVPATVQVGRATLGPGDMLRAMAQVLTGAQEIILHEGPQVPKAAARPDLAHHQTSSQWCHPPEWTSEIVDNRLRWQSWTLRPV